VLAKVRRRVVRGLVVVVDRLQRRLVVGVLATAALEGGACDGQGSFGHGLRYLHAEDGTER
jgi:hypothetical protein